MLTSTQLVQAGAVNITPDGFRALGAGHVVGEASSSTETSQDAAATSD